MFHSLFCSCTVLLIGFLLQVYVFTLRNEDRYLAWDFGQDVHNAFDFYLNQHVDGMFTDFPQSLARHLDLLYKNTSAARLTMNALYVTSVVIAVSVVVVFVTTSGFYYYSSLIRGNYSRLYWRYNLKISSLLYIKFKIVLSY